MAGNGTDVQRSVTIWVHKDSATHHLKGLVSGGGSPLVSEAANYVLQPLEGLHPFSNSTDPYQAYSCDSVADEALKIETPAGQDKLIGIVERQGPQTDRRADPPEDGVIYPCTGQGVFNCSSTTRQSELGHGPSTRVVTMLRCLLT